jgi:hypothetical protein
MTEISWPSPYGITDFCDDIRNELFGKTTFVGLYAGEMKIYAELPAAIPKLCLAIRFFEKADDIGVPLILRVFLPGDEADAATYNIPVPPRQLIAPPPSIEPGEDFRVTSHFAMQIAPLLITEEGSLRVRMVRGDDVFRLGSLRISPGTREEAAAVGAQFGERLPGVDVDAIVKNIAEQRKREAAALSLPPGSLQVQLPGNST